MLTARLGASFCLRSGLLPWRRLGGATVILVARDVVFFDHEDRLRRVFGPVRALLCPEETLRRALQVAAAGALVAEAETRVPAAQSCRGHCRRRAAAVAGGALACLLVLLALAPGTVLRVGAILAAAVAVAASALRLAAAAAALLRRPPGPVASAPVPARLPVVSVLVPLYQESAIAGQLMARFDRIDYPRDRLDLCLILEEEDEVTRAAIAAAALPGWVQVIEVPSGSVRTKPRALNYALNFARGTIVGIWDAEDAPAPDQLRRVVQRFAERGPDVACLQGVLDYYNPRANWLARCFTLEYALWFRLLLPGVARLGLVVPLGGTTLFLRRHAIEAVCGWDAHNVTEDADLGVRLARAGFRTELLDTVTEEEANARLWPWVRQRSRWLKGYAVTWAVHMRRPWQLRQEIGTRAFLGFQIQFLGTVLHYLTAPLLWGFWALALGIVPAPYGSAGGVAIRAALGFLLVAEVATMALAAVAVRRAGKPDVARWAPTLLFYFPLATIAAWKGLWEAILHPFFWDKTTHGFFPLPQAAPAPDVARAPAPPAPDATWPPAPPAPDATRPPAPPAPDVTGPPASAPRRSSAG